jgi:hypothetical protein
VVAFTNTGVETVISADRIFDGDMCRVQKRGCGVCVCVYARPPQLRKIQQAIDIILFVVCRVLGGVISVW